jgi:glutathione S-transferase
MTDADARSRFEPDQKEPFMSLHLVIGNKNYSSWSMRPWVLLKSFDIEFTEVMLKFESDEWRRDIAKWSPARTVPVLWTDAAPKGEVTWDSLAIIETVAERFANLHIWPQSAAARNHARCAVAEMHSGFRGLRSAMPMNVRARIPGLGINDESSRDLGRIEALWAEARERFGKQGAGPFLYGAFSAADAYFAPVVMRFNTYQPKLKEETAAYCEAVRHWPAVEAWTQQALAETRTSRIQSSRNAVALRGLRRLTFGRHSRANILHDVSEPGVDHRVDHARRPRTVRRGVRLRQHAAQQNRCENGKSTWGKNEKHGRRANHIAAEMQILRQSAGRFDVSQFQRFGISRSGGLQLKRLKNETAVSERFKLKTFRFPPIRRPLTHVAL